MESEFLFCKMSVKAIDTGDRDHVHATELCCKPWIKIYVAFGGLFGKSNRWTVLGDDVMSLEDVTLLEKPHSRAMALNFPDGATF